LLVGLVASAWWAGVEVKAVGVRFETSARRLARVTQSAGRAKTL
jgi:hypothetical protein